MKGNEREHSGFEMRHGCLIDMYSSETPPLPMYTLQRVSRLDMKLITSNVKSFAWKLRGLKGFLRPVIQPGVGVIEMSVSICLSALSY